MIKDCKSELYDKDYPLVSVVIPTYNRFQYLWNAIDSVLCQDYPSLQLIISDDCSKNFPQEQIEQYLKDNMKSNIKGYNIIHHESNIGTVRNLNNAYSIADGQYIFPLSNDDEFISVDVISKIIDVFLKKQCNIVITSRLQCDENGKTIGYMPMKSAMKYINKLDTREKQYRAFIMEEYYDMASGSALYLRKSFWEMVGKFDEKYRLWEDGPFIAKALLSEKIEMCFQIISIKYRTGGVSSGKKHPQLVADKSLFDHSDKIENMQELDWLAKKKIEFDIARNDAVTKKEIALVYLLNPVGTFQRIIYKFKRKRAFYEELHITNSQGDSKHDRKVREIE